MFIIRNIPEQKYFADIKPVTVAADSPDLSDYVTELAYLKGLAHAKIIKKSVILFRVLNMTI